MKVVANEKCVGNGICEGIHPSVFEVGDDGVVIVHNDNIREEDRELVIEAVDSCPAQALSFVDEQ
jgi:ferredoxin